MSEIKLQFEDRSLISIEITHTINGVSIFYPSILFNGVDLLKTDINSFLCRIVDVMKTLSVKARMLVIELWPEGQGSAYCNVDVQDIIDLVLTINIRNGHILLPSRGSDENYLLYHELMHAKDVLEGRFPSSGLIDITKDFLQYLVGFAEDFSIEGRLGKIGRPHYTRKQSIENAYRCVAENYHLGLTGNKVKKPIRKEFFEKLCDNVWGKELTSEEAHAMIKELMVQVV